uniref:Ig-like domain-containing protein n=1 Tax=Scleropages formosus TaxID=113540 RepID=A0A8C9VMU6_SCLFO
MVVSYKYCVFFSPEIRAQDRVTQSTGDVIGYEGGSVTLNCDFTTSSTAPFLFWYIQHPNGSPKYILRRHTSGASDTAAEFKDRFDANIEKTTVPLTIQRLQLTDSAVYYCALTPTVMNSGGDVKHCQFTSYK